MEQPTVSVTVYWGYTPDGFAKQMNFGWLEYKYYFLQSPRALRIIFCGGEIEVRCELSAKSDYPLGDLLKDFREHQVYGLYDLEKRGFSVRVYQMIRGPDGNMLEEAL